MCLAAFAIGCHADFPLVLAANRDEFFERPTAPLAWWPAAGATPAILAGRDLRGGGTWLGLNTRGRLALLTNIRSGRGATPGAPSRGEMVPAWLGGTESPAALHTRMQARGQVDYNLVTAELGHSNTWHWISSARAQPQPIDVVGAGRVIGLSNGVLDEPWPKLVGLRARLAAAVEQASAAQPQALLAALFDALANDHVAPDDQLPSTGVALPHERMLSSAFIRSADGRYGTRCSTIVLVQRGVGARVVERSFDPSGKISAQVDLRVPGWPS